MLKPKRVNQLTIAKALKVSRATVSLVLSGGTGASAETTQKVLNLARKMGYRPNALVHSIRSGRSRTVGVLVPPHDSHWQAVCYGIHDRLVEAEHLPLFLWDTEYHHEQAETYALTQINRLLDRWVDGAILWPSFSNYYAKHLGEFQSRNIPLLIIDHSIRQLEADTVTSDENKITELLVSHLVSLGHRIFLSVPGPPDIGWADARAKGILAQLQAVPDTYVITLRPEFHTDVETQIAERLRANPNITAIIGGTDNLAKWACNAVQSLGRSVPEDISVIGVGDLNFSKWVTPALTTVNQNGYEMGKMAAQMVLERSSGILTGNSRHQQIPVKLIERQSTARVRG